MDGGYARPMPRGGLERVRRLAIQIVMGSDTVGGFEVVPRRWIVECAFAYLRRYRVLAGDWEKSIESAKSGLLNAHIRRVTRLLTRS